MPSMASIVVKKYDEVTDITYDALVGAGADGTTAVWRQDLSAPAALPVGFRAMLTMSAQSNGPRTARRMLIAYKRPYALLNSASGFYESRDSYIGRVEIVSPVAIPATDQNEATYQFLNLLGKVSGLIKTSVASGYAPT